MCGSLVSDNILLICILDGLPLSYHSFSSSIQIYAQTCLLSLEELYILLICEEINLIEEASMQSTTAFIALIPTKVFNPGHDLSHRRYKRHHNNDRRPNHLLSEGILPSSNEHIRSFFSHDHFS